MEHDTSATPAKKDPWATWGLAVAAVAILVIGGAVGYYIGFDIGYERATGSGKGIVEETPDTIPGDTVSTFDECVAAGNPVMESYPRQCRSTDGQLFVEEVPPLQEPSTREIHLQEGCAIGGCSGQICGEAGEVEHLVTTCEFRPEHACVRLTTCKRHADGFCAWIQTDEYSACLQRTSSAEVK